MDWQKLIQDLRDANQAAKAAADKSDDGGSANLDSVFLRIPRQREVAVLKAIQEAGLYCREKSQWIGAGYFIDPQSGGQGNKNFIAVSVMTEHLQRNGWDALDFRKMD